MPVKNTVPAEELVCKRCLWKSHNAIQLIRHLNVNNMCKPLDDDHDYNNEELIQKIRDIEAKKYDCKYCKQLFAHSSSKTYHEQNNCHVRKTNIVETVEPTIQLIEINKEDLNIIPDNIIDSYIYDIGKKTVNFNMIEMIKYIHFNPEYPQFQNIRKQNKKLGTLSIYQDGNWIEHACENIIKMMLLRVTSLFEKRAFINHESNVDYSDAAMTRLTHFRTSKREYVNARNFILIDSDRYICE
jgi:hypothetical protein